METITYYYKREDGSFIFSVRDTIGIRRTIVKDATAGEQYLRMLQYSKKTIRKLYLDLQEDYRLIKRFFFTPSYWEAKAWQEEYTTR